MARPLWLAGGVLFTGLGIAGLILPFMPGVVFLLIAAACFARSKPEWEERLLDHPRVGKPLRDWRERQAIARPAKKQALVGLAMAAVIAALLTGFPLAAMPIGAMALVALWIWTRPE